MNKKEYPQVIEFYSTPQKPLFFFLYSFRFVGFDISLVIFLFCIFIYFLNNDVEFIKKIGGVEVLVLCVPFSLFFFPVLAIIFLFFLKIYLPKFFQEKLVLEKHPADLDYLYPPDPEDGELDHFFEFLIKPLTPFFKYYLFRNISLPAFGVIVFSSLCVFSSILLLFLKKSFLGGLAYFKFYCAYYSNFIKPTYYFDPYLELLNFDFFSLYFILLTSLLIHTCIVFGWASLKFKFYDFCILLFFLELLLFTTFLTKNLFVFYVSYESTLIPMFMIIGIWGSRIRKINAAYRPFFFTFLTSIPLFISLIYFYAYIDESLTIPHLYTLKFTIKSEIFFFLCFFLAFASKIPMFPFHNWLPEAHVEAPTIGSVLLAGILLKIGAYGLIRFVLPMFPNACIYFQPLIYLFSVIGIFYASVIIFSQTDLKKMIAYSSIAHMSYATVGIFNFDSGSLSASIFILLSHGLVSSALFFCVGFLYDRYGTNNLYYGRLATFMPIFLLCSFFVLRI